MGKKSYQIPTACPCLKESTKMFMFKLTLGIVIFETPAVHWKGNKKEKYKDSMPMLLHLLHWNIQVTTTDFTQDSPTMDPAMDELIDLLSYDCPFTGKKRTAGHYLDNQNLQCLGRRNTTWNHDPYSRLDVQLMVVQDFRVSGFT